MTLFNQSRTIKKPTLSGKNFYLYGDSITFGYLASSNAARYSTLLCGYLGATEQNYGVSSSTLEKRSPTDPLSATNMVDRVSTIPTKSSGDGGLLFMFGMNDWGYNGTNYNRTNFIADYNTIISNALSKSWSASDIVICSPSAPNSDAIAFYDSINSTNSGPSLLTMLDFVGACENVAITNGTHFVNCYQVFSAASGVLNTDGVHPNDPGHLVIAKWIYNYLK
jgi:lysophospholipase L1-like esterase